MAIESIAEQTSQMIDMFCRVRWISQINGC
jgi:hypothetical protein